MVVEITDVVVQNFILFYFYFLAGFTTSSSETDNYSLKQIKRDNVNVHWTYMFYQFRKPRLN